MTTTDQGRLAAPDGEVAPADDTWDDAWLEPPAPRSKLRTALVLALAASLFFLGGALVQRQFGSAAGAGQMAAGFPGGDASGGFPGGGQMPSGVPSGMPTSGAQGQSADRSGDDQTQQGQSGDEQSGGDQSGDAGQQVIGTVTKKSGDTWVVTDLGGTKHTITLGEGTQIREEKSVTADEVATGSTVDITTEADGSATAITIR